MKGITEYFHSREDSLQRKLFSAERNLQQSELLNLETQEKQRIAQEQMEKEHKECEESKQQLHAVIKSLYNQVHVNKGRADDAMVRYSIALACIM